jgi:hypothetical protein
VISVLQLRTGEEDEEKDAKGFLVYRSHFASGLPDSPLELLCRLVVLLSQRVSFQQSWPLSILFLYFVETICAFFRGTQHALLPYLRT